MHIGEMEWKGDDIDPEDVRVDPDTDGDTGDADTLAAGKVKKLKEEIESLRKEKQEYLDGWQRAKADYVNLLRRLEDAAKLAEKSGVGKAVEMLLPAYDALERAKEHGEVPTGFQAIAKQIEAGFKAVGLEPVGQVGEKFNPSLHEALGQDAVESADEDDTVTAVLEKGWKVGEQVLRPAKVRVGVTRTE